MHDKLDKPVVLYFPAEQVGEREGARCGKCMMFTSNDNCTVVEGPINGDKGVCGLYVHGKHMGPAMQGDMPKEVVGYINNAPTHCGSCKFYEGDDEAGLCQVVEGTVEYFGCCNSWESGKPKEREWRI